MSDPTTATEDLLKEIKEAKKRSQELAEKAERHVTLAFSADIILAPCDDKKDKKKDNEVQGDNDP